MARPLRVCVAGGVYHLIARGNARGDVYRDDADRSLFLETLAHTVARFDWICHAYCLMDNHYHLVVETPRANLPAGMRQLNGLYAQRFNRRHDRCGHVFQARYRSILIEKQEHLLTACRYVVLNPVRAGICTDPSQYRGAATEPRPARRLPSRSSVSNGSSASSARHAPARRRAIDGSWPQDYPSRSRRPCAASV